MLLMLLLLLLQQLVQISIAASTKKRSTQNR
jgi:hypothetical protein